MRPPHGATGAWKSTCGSGTRSSMTLRTLDFYGGSYTCIYSVTKPPRISNLMCDNMRYEDNIFQFVYGLLKQRRIWNPQYIGFISWRKTRVRRSIVFKNAQQKTLSAILRLQLRESSHHHSFIEDLFRRPRLHVDMFLLRFYKRHAWNSKFMTRKIRNWKCSNYISLSSRDFTV